MLFSYIYQITRLAFTVLNPIHLFINVAFRFQKKCQPFFSKIGSELAYLYSFAITSSLDGINKSNIDAL